MSGRKQPHPFDPERAAVLDDPERERWLPTERIVALLDARDGMNVLDYGAGTGRYTTAIARARPGANVTAFDIAPRMLEIVGERAAREGLQNVRTAGPDPSSVPGGAFDRAVGVHLLHEIDDEHVRQIYHALKPGGSLLVVDWDAEIARDFGPPPEHVHSQREALERLQRAGFTTTLLESPDFPYHFAIRAVK